MKIALCLFVITALGAGVRQEGDKPRPSQRAWTSGTESHVKFATAYAENADPALAGREATKLALDAVGTQPKVLVYYVYYQSPENKNVGAVAPDLKAEEACAKAVNQAAGSVPNAGCRARPLTNGGTLLTNAVAVLAVGGAKVSAGIARAPILNNRLSTGQRIAAGLHNVKDLRLIIALAEPELSFGAPQGYSVEDFIRGTLEKSSEGATLFGGNSMPHEGLKGRQFLNGQALEGHVVAVGLGGPLKVYSNHTNEFDPSSQSVTVTKAKDKWVLEFDGKPAEQVYRQLRGMTSDEKLTSDSWHPIGVVVAPGKVYLRMILDWVDKDGKDREGKAVDVPTGSLRFVSPVAEGTKVQILKGKVAVADRVKAIIRSAGQGIGESMGEAKSNGDTPALVLVSDCCARGSRLRRFRKESGDQRADEVLEAIIPAMGGREVPVFGFDAFGELGAIRGQYQGLKHQYQQHTFVSAVIAVD